MNHPVPPIAAALVAALAGALWLTAWTPAAEQQGAARRHRVAVFFEPGFPAIHVGPPDERALRQALTGLDATFLGAEQLASALTADRFDTLVMPFGSAFPEAAWPAILAFLRSGGSWVQPGGKPFAVPVARADGRWQIAPETTACYKALGFTHIFEVPASAVSSWETAPGGAPAPESLASGFAAEAVYEADIRLTNTRDFADEDGSDGPREGRVQPLVFALDRSGRPVAAPLVRIDRTAGPFAGGAWLLAPIRGRVAPATIRWLVEAAWPGAVELSVRPAYAGFLPGEGPAVEVGLRWPRSGAALSVPAIVTVTAPGGRTILTTNSSLSGSGGFAAVTVTVPASGGALERGLYEVRASVVIGGTGGTPGVRLEAVGGFWSYDPSMLRGGVPLAATRDGFTRGGRPFPVLGTTYMSSDVHRRFLLEPNPHAWNRDFAAMKAAGVNLVRTGLWTGWRRDVPEAGRVNEGALRALDVFLLTAREHDIPVVFNLFAFLPEAWGGENPYLDPRAVSAQQAFLGVLARRYAGTDDLAWDLINEPSFSAAAQLWKTRPNADPSELAAWDRWLRARYGEGGAGHAAAARRAWGAAPDEDLALPSLDDFIDRHLFGAARPLKAADYKRFSQDMFAVWIEQMSAALRDGGNRLQLITVGQDEGGLSERPNPLLFGHAVDFTCMHTWWNNDALPWDAILSRLPDRPMLVEETGMMRYERIDGTPWRTEQEASALLERKLAMAVGAGSSGYVQWIWNTNPYMASDNEAGIGFFRADGTARPELAPFVGLSRFLAEHADRFHGREEEDVVLLVPQSQMFSPRSHAVEATQRAVRVLTNHLGIVPRAVNELRAAATLGTPRLVIAPAPRVLTDDAWRALLEAVSRGATLLVTGIIDANENWQRVDRSGGLGLQAGERPVAGEEILAIDGRLHRLGYRGDKLERLQAAAIAGQPPSALQRVARGRGTILWAPLPVELSDSTDATSALYRAALAQADVKAPIALEPRDPSVFAGATVFADAILVSLASESSRDIELTVSVPGTPGSRVLLPAGRAAVLLLDRKTGGVLGRARQP